MELNTHTNNRHELETVSSFSIYITLQCIALFARSDWFTRRRLASTIYLRAAGARDFKIADRLSRIK